MNSILYNQTLPENNKASWKEFENIDFVFNFENQALLANTIRFEADIQVFKDATNRVSTGDNITLDPKIGGHGVIQSVTTSFQTKGILENLTDYPRLVKMRTDAQNTADNMLDSNHVCELRAPDESISPLLLYVKTPKIFGGGGLGNVNLAVDNNIIDPDFSIKPHICINNVYSDNKKISFSQSGSIRISLILERDLGVLSGSDMAVTSHYTLSNCRMTFQTVQDISPLPIELRSSLCLKSNLSSAFNNVSSNVPAVSDSVSISFIKQTNEYSLGVNNTKLEQPPNITRLSYLYNDNTNRLITYELKNRTDMLYRGLQSLNFTSQTSVNLENIQANKSYLLGLRWSSPVSLANNKFNIQLTTDISSTDQYVMFSYFHSVLNFD